MINFNMTPTTYSFLGVQSDTSRLGFPAKTLREILISFMRDQTLLSWPSSAH